MLRSVFRATCCGALLVCAGRGVAQDAAQNIDGLRIAGLNWFHVHAANASKVGLVLAWPVGAEHDLDGRTGLAQAMRAFLELCQRDLEPEERLAAEACGRFTLLWATVPVQDLPVRLGFLGRLLGGEIQITDDLHALALARARLRADDNTRLYPGPSLHNKARRCLFQGDPRGRPVDGVPVEIARITKAELAARYKDHYGTRGAFLATVGGVAAADLEKRLRQHLAAASGSNSVPVPVRPAAAKPVVRSEIHPRVDGPYVTVAIPAPEPGHFSAAFLVAVSAMRHQAQAYFGRYRGGEWRARFAFVRYDFLAGDPLVMINRRGRDAGAAEDVRKEIRGFLRSIRRHGLREQYLQMAYQELTNTLQRPWQGGPKEVVFRARVLCLRKLLGLDDAFVAQLGKTSQEEARTELLSLLREERECWLAFLPGPTVTVKGFRTKRR